MTAKGELLLNGNENLLYSFMREERSDMIVPQLVNDLLKSIIKSP